MNVRIVILPLLLCALSGCAQQNEVATLQNRVNQQDQTIRQLNSQLSGVQPAQADTWAQVQALRQEMATLRGQIDNLNNATSSIGGVSGLADRVSRHDAALRMLETQLALNLNLGSAAPGTPGAYPSEGTQGGLPPVLPGTQTQAPAQPQSQAPAQTQAPAATTDLAKALYDSGYKSFTGGKYNESLNAFTDFTKTYTKHALIGNAWFWKGESNFGLKNYANAALDYEKLIKDYPSNAKVPSAYLKQAMSFANVNKKDVARYRLEDLIKKFPNAPEAARAKKMLAEMK